MLDERRYRDVQPQNAFFSYGSVDPAIKDPNRTMLGVAQRDWLIDGLQASDAAWKLLGNPVPFFPFVLGPALATTVSDAFAPLLGALPPVPPPLTVDDWNGYQVEQQALVGVLSELDDVVVLTGDYHESFVADVPSRPGDYALDANSVGVEVVVPSVTSPGLGATLEAGGLPDAQAVEAAYAANLSVANPWVRYHEPRSNGFGVVDVTESRTQFDIWFVDDPLDPASGARAAASWEVARGSARATPAAAPLADRACAVAAGEHPTEPGTPNPGQLPVTGRQLPLGAAGAGALAALAAITARRAALGGSEPS
jgi:alkaline phosphatase D